MTIMCLRFDWFIFFLIFVTLIFTTVKVTTNRYEIIPIIFGNYPTTTKKKHVIHAIQLLKISNAKLNTNQNNDVLLTHKYSSVGEDSRIISLNGTFFFNFW